MVTIPVSEAEVMSIRRSLKPKGTSGYDGISSNILKQCVHTVIKPLTYICNLSLTTGVFPERCKPAIIRPICKKGDHSEITNYRPISLLPTISKILEKVMFNRLSQHLDSNNLLTSSQFWFRKNVHINDAIFFLLDNIITPLDQRKCMGGIFCDLTKAFDCVSHDILLNKLQHCGVRGVCLSWFQSYLANRKQKVCISANISKHETSSSWEEILSEVPQGSILGPLLFIIYLNDLPYGPHQENKTVIYADDVSVLLTASNEAELTTQISHMLDYLTEWFSVNGLILNTDKTNIMKFSPSNRQNNSFQFTHHTKLLVAANNTKFLGLNLTNM